MDKNDNFIAGKKDLYPQPDEYSRLERLMRGNEEEHRRRDKTYLWMFIIVCAAVFYAAIQFKSGKDDIKAKAAAAIDRYVQQTYGAEFDKFEKSDHIGTYVYNGELTLLSQGYTDPEWPDGSFSIAVDTDYNIVRDGYQTNYLKGSTIFSTLDYQYARAGQTIESEFCILAGEQQYITMADNIYIYADFDRKDDPYSHADYAYNSSGIYTGPVLSLENPPTMNELAQEYGLIELEINLAKPTQQRYADIILSLCDYLDEKDLQYNCMDIIINSKADMGNRKKHRFDYTVIADDGFAVILADRLAESGN